MSKKYFMHIIWLVAVLLGNISIFAKNKPRNTPPKLIVVMVFDQFAYHYIPKLRNNFKYGIKELLDNGIVYKKAYHAHAIPETTPGHHAISTGTLPKDHGAILNQWINEKYEKVPYELDAQPDAALLNSEAIKLPGKSCKNTMVDGLSDQFMQSSNKRSHHKTYALSIKSYPAISMANRLGKAIWFDSVHGNFTSSKKYFSQPPSWLSHFNQEQKISELKHVTWKTMYPEDSSCYDFPDIKNYDYAGYPFSLVSIPKIAIDRKESCPYDLYVKTPHASKALLELATTCVKKNLTHDSDRMLLWISCSNLDLAGHFYGPDSIEIIDILYHLDKQIHDFMNSVKKQVGEKNCLFVLTGDHGIPPIPELSFKRGNTLARRVLSDPLIKDMNNLLLKKYDVSDIVKAYEPTAFYLNKERLKSLDRATQKNIILDIKDFLINQPGIKRVWTSHELAKLPTLWGEPEHFYKTQLYHGRSGDIICQPQPYCIIGKYPTGTSHMSPYDYDTHVPLVIYQKETFEKKVITDKVWVPQLPATLAYIAQVSKPSASTLHLLPGIAK